MSARLAKYNTVVYAANLHAGRGTPVVVYAENKQEAINRAVEIGWGGLAEDALVQVISVEDVNDRGGAA